MGPRCCIVALPRRRISRSATAHRRTPRGRSIEAGSSLVCTRIASLQSIYSDDQVRTFENFDQLVESTFDTLRSRLKVILENRLRLANRIECQLLIGHMFLPIHKLRPAGMAERNQDAFGEYSRYSLIFDQILFQYGTAGQICHPEIAHERGDLFLHPIKS
jgi:hypothetical protein